MLRIDETSKTLVAPEPASYVAEPALEAAELHALLAAGWEAFAAEIGQPHLRFLAASPAEGVGLLAFDEAAGSVVVVEVVDGRAVEALGRALAAAAVVAGWDAARLAEVHEGLQAAVPGDSPRVVLVAGAVEPSALTTMDWLVRRHGHEVAAYLVQVLRLGEQRMIDISRAYPAPDPAAAAAPASAPFVAGVAGSVPAPGHSAPPPGVPAA